MPSPPLRHGVAVAPPAPAKPHRLLLPSPGAASLRCRCRRSSWFSNAEPGDDATKSRRRWWSDTADDFEEDEHDDGGGVFGGAGGLFDEPWFSKVLKTYRYVLPVVLASMLVATGPNAFLMAMAIPLAQTAVSFALRAIWGRGLRDKDQQEDDDYAEYSNDFQGQEYKNPRIVEVAGTDSHGGQHKKNHKQHQIIPAVRAAVLEDGTTSTATGAAAQQEGLNLEEIPRLQ